MKLNVARNKLIKCTFSGNIWTLVQKLFRNCKVVKVEIVVLTV